MDGERSEGGSKQINKAAPAVIVLHMMVSGVRVATMDSDRAGRSRADILDDVWGGGGGRGEIF